MLEPRFGSRVDPGSEGCDPNNGNIRDAHTAGRTNSLNSFAYNHAAARNYISTDIEVYQKSAVQVPVDVFKKMKAMGMYDPQHIYGLSVVRSFDFLSS